MKSSRWVILMLAMQAMILLGQWVGQPSISTAQAQIPDAGAQRNEMIEQVKTTNDKLDQLITLLQSGDVKVKAEVTNAEKAK